MFYRFIIFKFSRILHIFILIFLLMLHMHLSLLFVLEYIYYIFLHTLNFYLCIKDFIKQLLSVDLFSKLDI
jgi:uncharacterized protein YybS (DUF2232 family)